MSINIDIKQRTIEDHSMKDSSAKQLKQVTTQGRNTRQSHNSQQVSARNIDQRNNNTAGSELHKGFMGKQIGNLPGEFDNFDRQLTNQPSDLFKELIPRKKNKQGYSRSPQRMYKDEPVTLVKVNQLGHLYQPKKIQLIKNANQESKESLRLANQSQGRPQNTGYSGAPMYGTNLDLVDVSNDRKRKSFSPGYSRISKGQTSFQQSQTRGNKASPAPKMSNSDNFRGSSGKQRSNFNKNSQIRNKFNQTDKEYPLIDPRETATQKALVKKMKELSGSRIKPVPVKQQKSGKQISLKKKKAAPNKKSQIRNYQDPNQGQVYNLQKEYNQRRERMDSRLSDEVQRISIIPQAIVVSKNDFKDVYRDRRDDSEGHKSQSSLVDDLDLIPGHDDSPQMLKPNLQIFDHFRSKRQVENVLQNRFTQDVNSLDYDKTELIQEINDRLIELDHLNQEKKDMSNQLINQIKFVRDLQSSLGTADNGHINDIVDHELKERFNEEKQENIRLKELRKKDQTEINDIKYQLGILNGDHQVTVVDKQGKEVNFRKALMGVEDMMSLQADFDRISEDRTQIAERVRGLQHEYDTTFNKNEAHVRQMAYQFRLSKTRYSGKVLITSLEKLFNMRISAHFQQVRHQNKCDERTIAAILAFRKICYNYDDSRQKMYLQKWFHNALKPAQMIYQNKNVVDFINKNQKMKNILIRWHHAQIQAHTQNSYDSQKIQDSSKVLYNYYIRQYRHAFDVWRHAHGSKGHGQKKILAFIMEQFNEQKRQALLLWKNHVETQNFQMKLQAQAVRYTVLQYKSGLFYAWRLETTNLKRQRLSLMIRTLKILNRHRITSQHIRHKFSFIMKHNDKKLDHDLKSVFQALKHNKEIEKHQKVQSRLNEENSTISKTQEDHKSVEARSGLKAMVRAVNKGILNPFKGLIKSYFDKWNGTHQYIKQTMNGKIKSKIIKIYQNRLREAWDKWHVQGHAKKRRKKMMMHTEMESSNAATHDEIQKTMAEVQAAEVRSVNTGNSKVKKLMMKCYLAELKDALYRWKGRITHEDMTGQKLSNGVLRKWQKRLWNDAFQKWKSQHNAGKREVVQEKRTDDTIIKFQNRMIKRLWDAMEAHAHIKTKTRKKFGKILAQEYLKFQKVNFNKWKVFGEAHEKKRLHKKQIMHTDEMSQKISEKADHEDLLHNQEQKHADLVRSSQSIAQKNIKKFIQAWKNSTQYEAFIRWKNAQDSHKEAQSKIQHSIFKRMYNHITRDAFQTWRRNLVIVHKMTKKFSMQMETENHQVQTEKLEKTRTKITQQREKSTHMVKSLKQDQNYSKDLHAKQVELMTKHVLNNFVVTKREQIFAAWRDLAHSKAVKMKKLVKLLNKNYLQHGLNTLSIVHHKVARKTEHDKKMLKFLKGWGIGLKRDAVHLWKQRCFQAVIERTKQLQETHFHAQNNSNINRDNEIVDQAPKYLLKMNQRIMKLIFEEIFNYRCKRMEKSTASIELEDKFGFLRKRYQFQKWRLRADQTIIFRQKQKVLLKKWHIMRKKNLFNALLGHHSKYNKFQRLLRQIQQNLIQEHLRYGFKQIQNKAHQIQQTSDRKFKDSQKLVHNLSLRLRFKYLKLRFDQFLTNGRLMHKKKANLHSIMHKVIDRSYRDLFNRWKKNAELLEVVRFNHEEGPIRIEIYQKKAEITALKYMLKDKMILDDKGINDILGQNEEKYILAVSKTLGRFKHFGNGNKKENYNWLLPYCIDKWKLWHNERKSYLHALKTVEIHCKGGELTDVGHAFKQWKRNVAQRYDHLQAQTQEYLFDLDHQNHMSLLDAKLQLEDAHNEIGNMKNQREYLINKVVLGQRLALSRMRFSFRHALNKSFIKWNHHAHGHMQKQYHGHLTGNKDTIEAHKQRLHDVHEENMNIAEQNDGLHEGAQEGVAELEKLETLHEDVTELNEKIVTQAAQLKQLLDKNKKLKEELAANGQ